LIRTSRIASSHDLVRSAADRDSNRRSEFMVRKRLAQLKPTLHSVGASRACPAPAAFAFCSLSERRTWVNGHDMSPLRNAPMRLDRGQSDVSPPFGPGWHTSACKETDWVVACLGKGSRCGGFAARLFRRQHQPDNFFRDIRLEALGMSFVEANDVCDDAALGAFGVHIEPRSPRSRLAARDGTAGRW